MANTFGPRLRSIREAKGLTQQQLADALGVARPRVAEWEADRKRPRLDTLQALARALGCGLGDFDVR